MQYFLCYFIYWFQFIAEHIAEKCQVTYSIAKQRATVTIELLLIFQYRLYNYKLIFLFSTSENPAHQSFEHRQVLWVFGLEGNSPPSLTYDNLSLCV